MSSIETVLSWPSVRDVRDEYGYSGTRIYDLLGSGVLTGQQINGQWRIDPKSIAEFEKRPRRWGKTRAGADKMRTQLRKRKSTSLAVPSPSIISEVLKKVLKHSEKPVDTSQMLNSLMNKPLYPLPIDPAASMPF